MQKRKTDEAFYRARRFFPVAILTVIVILLLTLLPVGADSKSLLCYAFHTTSSLCESSTLKNEMMVRTQVALEQTQTSIAETLQPTNTPDYTQPTPASWPHVFKVDSMVLWQDTGMYVHKGDTVTFGVLDGEWTKNKGDTVYTRGGGTGYVCGREGCVEPLPGAPTDALIGRIDDSLFFVGQGNVIVAEKSGSLALRMNDGDYDMWDNDGVLTVGIRIE